MVAATARDDNGVDYYFANMTDPLRDSGWVDGPQWTDAGLLPNTLYEYRVKARDGSVNQNETGWSLTVSVMTPRLTVWTIRRRI